MSITLDDDLISKLQDIVRSQVPNMQIGVSWQESVEYAIKIAHKAIKGENIDG